MPSRTDNEIHTAMILAAGYGKRMQEMTNHIPKVLLKISGLSLLDINLLKLRNAGIRRVIINLHYHGEKIKSHLANKPLEGLEIIYSEEKETLLGTGGGIARARKWFQNEHILVVNSDIISDISLRNFIRYYFHRNTIAAMSVWPSKNYREYGLVYYDDQPDLTGFSMSGQKPPEGKNTGIYMGYQILSPRAQQYLIPEYSSVIESFYRPALDENKPIAVYLHSGSWVDIGTKEKYGNLKKRFEQKSFDLKPFF